MYSTYKLKRVYQILRGMEKVDYMGRRKMAER